MPIGYLVTTALVALGTYLAVAPIRRPRVFAEMSFRFGLLVNEQPFLAAYLLLASTWLASSEGDLDSTVGWIAFACAVAAMPGLVVIAVRQLRARGAIDDALRAGLGAGWRSSLDADTERTLRRRLPWVHILFAPLRVRRFDVERVANIRYGDASAKNRLDLYRHRSHASHNEPASAAGSIQRLLTQVGWRAAPRPRTGGPILVHLHGGHFRNGRKNREARPLLYRLASQGWVCISANYRLTPEATFPDQLIDAKRVLAWVREHGREYGADPTVLFLAGSSAGAHLAAMAALTPNDPTFQPGFEGADTSVTAAVGLYGYYGSLDVQQPPSSPAAYVGRQAPPFFLAHGDHDTLVPVEDVRAFVERLRGASSNAVVYAELPHAQHAFDVFHSIRFDRVVDGIEAFAAWVRSRPDAGAAAPGTTQGGSGRP